MKVFGVGEQKGWKEASLRKWCLSWGRVINGSGTCGQRQRVAGKEKRIDRYCWGFYLYPEGNGGFPGSSEVKASTCNAWDPGAIPGSGRFLGEGILQVFLPGESHGRRSLVGYSPQGHEESDTTERLHFHFHLRAMASQEEILKGKWWSAWLAR